MPIEPAVHPGGFPYARLFIVSADAVVILEIVVLVLAFRRLVPSLRLLGAAGAAVLVLLGIGAGAIRAARNIVVDAFGLYRAPWDAGYGIVAQVNAFPIVTGLCALAVLLWIAGLVVTLDARRRARDGGERTFPAVALVALGLLPLIAGIRSWSTILADAFRASVGIPRGSGDQLLLQGVEAARGRLESAFRVSTGAIVALAAVACALIVLRRRRQRDDGERAPRATVLVSAGALIVAALLFVAARPMRIENVTPWPAARHDEPAWLDGMTPDLSGPDALEPAPVVRMQESPGDQLFQVELDNRPIAADALVDGLWKLRNEFVRRHPDRSTGDFDGVVVATVSAGAPHRGVVSILRAMHDAGYVHPIFAFKQHEWYTRPRLGMFHRAYATGARVTLIDASDKLFADGDPTAGVPGAPVALSDDTRNTFEVLAGKIVELRRSGRPVVLDIDHLR
jgi:hypothetical protein